MPYPETDATLRDHFAASALQGILCNQIDDAVSASGHAEVADEYAEAAYRIADAMLRARITVYQPTQGEDQ